LGGQSSGIVEATFKLYLDEVLTGNGLHLNFNYAGAADFIFGDRATWVGAAHPDDLLGALGVPSAGAGAATLAFFDGSAWNPVTSGGTGMSIPYNSWVDMIVSIDLDADTHSLSVNGLASDTMGGALDVAVNGFNLMTNFSTSLSGNAYVDGEGAAQTPGDINGDGNVDLDDFEIIRLNYGMTGASKSDGD